MLAIIPVKLSERLPGKHFLTLGGKSIIEMIYEKVSRVFDVKVYSRMELPVPYEEDTSGNIMELVYGLRKEYGTFMMVGGDMPFFTDEDLRQMEAAFQGGPVTPRGEDGEIEPMFSIYAGAPSETANLRDALNTPATVYIDRKKFSKHAFFNVNTFDDYLMARRIYEEKR